MHRQLTQPPRTSHRTRWLLAGLLTLLLAACGGDSSDDSYDFDWCDEGTIRTSTCGGGICDPQPFDDCGNGSCVLLPGKCPASA